MTLPEDASREGCGVRVPDSRRAGSRQLGRLGGGQKNQEITREFAFLAPPGTPLFGGAHADPVARFGNPSFLVSEKKRPRRLILN